MKIPHRLWPQVFCLVLLTAFLFGCGMAGSSGSGGSGLNIASTSLPDATVSQSYSTTLQATGGTAPYSWSVTGGSLPAGLSLSTSGQITGTPTATGNYSFTVKVQDLHMSTSSSNINLKITGAPPGISSISPSTGSTNGGTSVTISGKNLQVGATVTFGGVAGTSVNVISSTQMTAVTPAHAAGSVDVVVTNPNGKSATLSAGFGYGSAAPIVSAISPNSGPTGGGTTVTITGNNFLAGALVFLGTVAASGVAVTGPTQIQATTPSVSTAAAVNVVVQNPDGQSGTLTNGFTYTDPPPSSAPTVSSVSPGTVTAGTAVTVDGTNFGSGATVSVGSTAASDVQFLSSTELSATVPSVSPGTYDVTVANTNGLSATLSGGLTVADPTSLLSGCTVTTSGTVGSTQNGSPAISCATPSGWTLVSAENFAGGVLHASDKTQLHAGSINCSGPIHSPGSCSYEADYFGDGNSYRWILDSGAIGSSSEVYVSWWEYLTAGATGQENFIFANLIDPTGTQSEIFDRWAQNTENRTTPDVPPGCLNGTGPGYDYDCQSAQYVMSGGSSSNTVGVNTAYYGGIAPFPIGTWTQYELHFKANSSGSNDGEFEFFVNGQLVNSTVSGNASGEGWPTGDLNGTGTGSSYVSMAGMEVDVGGYYQAVKTTDSTGTICEIPASAGSVTTSATNFSDFAPCPIPPTFSRYFDDIIVLKK